MQQAGSLVAACELPGQGTKIPKAVWQLKKKNSMASCRGFYFFVCSATKLASSSVLTRGRTQAPAVKVQNSDQIAREFPLLIF